MLISINADAAKAILGVMLIMYSLWASTSRSAWRFEQVNQLNIEFSGLARVRVIDQLADNDPAKALVLLEGVDAAIDDGQLHRDLVGRSAHPLFGGGGRGSGSFLPTTCLPDWNSDLRPRLGLLWLAVIGGERFPTRDAHWQASVGKHNF